MAKKTLKFKSYLDDLAKQIPGTSMNSNISNLMIRFEI